MEQELVSLKAHHVALKLESDALRHDPFRIEQLARERLGMAREGEMVYQFQDEGK